MVWRVELRRDFLDPPENRGAAYARPEHLLLEYLLSISEHRNTTARDATKPLTSALTSALQMARPRLE